MLVGLAILWSSAYAFAQVSVHQSQSSSMNMNGMQQQQSVINDNGKIFIHEEMVKSITIHSGNGILTLNGNKIQYCTQTCGPTYTLNSDGSIGK